MLRLPSCPVSARGAGAGSGPWAAAPGRCRGSWQISECRGRGRRGRAASSSKDGEASAGDILRRRKPARLDLSSGRTALGDPRPRPPLRLLTPTPPPPDPWGPPERVPQARRGQAPRGRGQAGAGARAQWASAAHLEARPAVPGPGRPSRRSPGQGGSGLAFLPAGGRLAMSAAMSAWVVTRPRPAVPRAQTNFFQQPLMVITVIGAAIYPLSNYDTQKKAPRTPCRGMFKTVSQLNRNPIFLALNF